MYIDIYIYIDIYNLVFENSPWKLQTLLGWKTNGSWKHFVEVW